MNYKYMRYLLSFIVSGILSFSTMSAQQNRLNAGQSNLKNKDVTAEKSIVDATFRGKVLMESTEKSLETASWSRNIYRIVSDSLETNSPLFTPVISNKKQANLFSLLITLLKDNKIKAYRFSAENVSIDDAEEISLAEILQANDIPYATAGSTISINPYDLPSNEVLSYYINEQWFYDTRTDKGGVKVKAICPVRFKYANDLVNVNMTNTPSIKAPLFWVSFDDVSPYLVRASIDNSFSDLGTDYDYSMFDFFKLRGYKGDVYRIGNRVLAEYFTTPADLAIEQANVEKKLEEIAARFSKFQ